MSEFTRMMWVSEEAEFIWKKRISRITEAFDKTLLELGGDRLVSILPYNLDALYRIHKTGVLVLGKEGTSNESYANAAVPYRNGQPYQYRVALTQNPDAWLEAWDKGDHFAIGQLLGYPECCSNKFVELWVKGGVRDFTYKIERKEREGFLQSVSPMNNLFLRWVGVRLVPFLPCKHNCHFARKYGERVLTHMYTKYPEEANWAEQLLSMPLKWSALHGIAEIQTPIFKVMTSTDYTKEKVELCLYGWFMPPESVNGLNFPYYLNNRWGNQMIEKNGFTSEPAMGRMHNNLLSAIEWLPNYARVLDLGSGNGLLLAKIDQRFGPIKRIGIECKKESLELAAKMFPEGTYHLGDTFDRSLYPQPCHLILVASNRFTERPNESIDEIRKLTNRLMVYSYNDKMEVTCYSKE